MDFENFLKVAKAYSDLGWAVQDQMLKLDSGEYDPDDCNPNALGMIQKFLYFASQRGVEGTDYILDMIEGAKEEE